MVSSRMECKGTRHDREMAALFAITVISQEGFYLSRSVLSPHPKARGDCCNFSGARDLTCLLIGVNTQHGVRLVRPVDLVQHLLRMRS